MFYFQNHDNHFYLLRSSFMLASHCFLFFLFWLIVLAELWKLFLRFHKLYLRIIFSSNKLWCNKTFHISFSKNCIVLNFGKSYIIILSFFILSILWIKLFNQIILLIYFFWFCIVHIYLYYRNISLTDTNLFTLLWVKSKDL